LIAVEKIAQWKKLKTLVLDSVSSPITKRVYKPGARRVHGLVPAQEGGTMVIPGRGRICDEADVVEYRDMLTIVRDRLKAMIKKGMTLEQIQAARPTLDYDPLYGSTRGPWTTDMFVEAAYRSLTQSAK